MKNIFWQFWSTCKLKQAIGCNICVMTCVFHWTHTVRDAHRPFFRVLWPQILTGLLDCNHASLARFCLVRKRGAQVSPSLTHCDALCLKPRPEGDGKSLYKWGQDERSKSQSFLAVREIIRLHVLHVLYFIFRRWISVIVKIEIKRSWFEWSKVLYL